MIPASRFKRFLAYFIDLLIVGIPSYPVYAVYYLQYGNWELPASFGYIMSAIYLIIGLFYFVLFESSRYRATLGKQLFNLYVSDLSDQRVSFSRALVRYLLWVLPSILNMFTDINNNMFDFKTNPYDSYISLAVVGLSLVWVIPVFFTEARTAVYDMLSGTRVNKRSTTNSPPSMSIQD